MAGLHAWPLYTPWWGPGHSPYHKVIGGPAAPRLIPMGLTFVLWARDALVRFRTGRAAPRYHVNSSQFSSCSFSHTGVSCCCGGRGWGIGTDRDGYLWNGGTEGWCKALWLWHWGTVRGECHSGMRGPCYRAWRVWVGGYSRLQHLHPCGHWCHCCGQTLQGSCEVHWIQTRCLPWCCWNWVGAEVGTLGEGRTRVEGRRAGHGCWGPGRRVCTQDSLRKAEVKGGHGGGERGCGVSPRSKGGHGVMCTPKHRVTGSHGHYGGCIRTPERCDRVGRRCDGVLQVVLPIVEVTLAEFIFGRVLLHLKPVGLGCREPHFQQWHRWLMETGTVRKKAIPAIKDKMMNWSYAVQPGD